ncbi:MAG: hypothetical protein HY831_05290 [Candidatus Aenigmarchaeota archaeon]|nr:hypothetical protein [Candidatus Aenigmarchaeota archaeon]
MIKLGKKHGLAVKVIAIILALVMLKIVLHTYGIQFISPTPIFVGLVSGAIFIIGFISAATMADYKESERMVSEIASSLDNILEEGYNVKKAKSKFDLDTHKKRLLDVVLNFKEDLNSLKKGRKSISSISKLSDSFNEMDSLGIVPNYVVRLKSEQGILNKNALRSFQIKETTFIPAAYSVVELVSIFLIAALMLMNLDPFVESLAVLSILMYVFIYMILFIKDMDDPFGGDIGYVNVDMFLLDEFEKKIKKDTG